MRSADQARFRHARYYAAVARQTDLLYRAGGDYAPIALTHFDQERGQIDAGWVWARSHTPDADGILLAYARATTSIGDLRYDARTQRRIQLEAALAAARRAHFRHQEGHILGKLGKVYWQLGELSQAIEHYQQYLVLAQEGGDLAGEATALGSLGVAYADLGDTAQAIHYYEQQLALVRTLGDWSLECAVLTNLGTAYGTQGALDQAATHLSTALGAARALGNRSDEAAILSNLGIVCKKRGDLDGAIAYYEQALAIRRALGDRAGEALTLGNLATTFRKRGDFEQATRYYEQRIALARQLGDRLGEALGCWNLGAALVSSDPMQAAALMQIRVDYERSVGHSQANAHAARVARIRAQASEPPGLTSVPLVATDPGDGAAEDRESL